MSSVTLLHPEETFTLPALQAMTKCSLFQKDPTLLVSPYRIHSPVSLSIFREFLSALEGNAINITNTNFTELQRLCKEFGFSDLSAQFSDFCHRSQDSQRRQIGNPLAVVRSSQLSDSFDFIVKEAVIETSISEAASLFPAVREQLSVDGCARKFFVKDSGIEAADIHSLQLLFSGERISIRRSHGLLSRLLGNVNLEVLFLDRSESDIGVNLSELMIERRIDLESVDVSVLSIEALDSLLLSELVTVESEDALLRLILQLGSDYRDLLRHIQIVFLSEDGLSVLDESVQRC
jgi:hypothetical protein